MGWLSRPRLRGVNADGSTNSLDGPVVIGPSAAVIGGGPGGLMAAEQLARAGASVTVYEQMPSMGRKFLIAGRGGLNLTHSEPLPQFLARYGDKQSELTPAVQAFPPSAVQDWCKGLAQDSFIGSSGRVFPSGFRATELLRSWLRSLEGLGVDLQRSQRWLGWDETTGALLVGSADQDKLLAPPKMLFPDITIMSLGGGSWERTGSDARWVPKFLAAGISVTELQAANSGFLVQWSSEFRSKFEAAPLKNIALTVNNTTVRGEAMISAHGIEGGCIYAVGRELRSAWEEQGAACIEIDLRPDLSLEQLEQKLLHSRPKDSTSTRLQRCLGLPPVSVGLMREATNNSLPRDHRELAQLVKALPLHLASPEGIDRAISTAGGVAFDELDDRYMIKKRPGVFVAGEMIDWEAPTGGYLLQATMSTAVAAARGAMNWWTEQLNAT
ncbi:MAG: TIGR03862 family flavoprotein [Actinobacteria bacterium]|uniref:Unannotated protein n=1 Tax=freshwater metagenome TaxID=449393 RepID=A0A6J6SWY3_9ZZZZ|nr:TIGR03862 family flavoprotein [Actinomycetota bacterium]